jgi:hypothetical protein
MHRLPACPRRLSLSRKGLKAAATETNSRPGAEDAMFAERNIFQNLVHSHTKASRRLGYVPIVTVARGLSTKIQFVGRWTRNSKVAKFGEILVLVGRVFVRRRWEAADSRSKWSPRPETHPHRWRQTTSPLHHNPTSRDTSGRSNQFNLGNLARGFPPQKICVDLSYLGCTFHRFYQE